MNILKPFLRPDPVLTHNHQIYEIFHLTLMGSFLSGNVLSARFLEWNLYRSNIFFIFLGANL